MAAHAHLRFLRGAAIIAVLAGAGGCLALTLYAGHRNPSRILMLLFAIWVLSPFVGLAVATVFSKTWSIPTRLALYTLMLILALASLAIYGTVALGPPRPKTAFPFLMVPLASWLLIAIVLPLATRISARAGQ